MGTRYTMLREAVTNLAASAEAQVAYLDRSFSGLTGGGSAEAYGNGELAMEFDDSFIAVGHMLECGEITQEEIDALRSIDDMLSRWSGSAHKDFWARRALFEDPRWSAIRLQAAEVLALLPDEVRESDYTRSLTCDRNGSFPPISVIQPVARRSPRPKAARRLSGRKAVCPPTPKSGRQNSARAIGKTGMPCDDDCFGVSRQLPRKTEADDPS